MTKRLTEIPSRRLEAIFVCIGVLLAVVLIALEQGRLNDDGVFYLDLAGHFARGDWAGGLALYPWPLYPILVAQISNLVGIGLEASANVLSVVFFAVAVQALARFIRLAGGDNLTVAAGMVLLLTNHYIVGDVLPLIWRDQGFWALFLTSLVFFLRFYRHGRAVDALIWQIVSFAAAQFRIEGLMFVLFMPLAVLLKPGLGARARALYLSRGYAISLVALSVVMVGLLSGAIDAVPPVTMARTYIDQSYVQFSEGLEAKGRIFGEQVLGEFIDDYAIHGLLLTLLAVLIGKITGAAGWLSFLLAGFQLVSRNSRMHRDAQVVLGWFALFAVLNMLITLFAYFLLSGRYVVPFAFIVTIFAAFGLDALLRDPRHAGRNARKWALRGVVLLLCVHVYMIFKPKPDGYTYEIDAVRWAREYAQDDRQIYYDNARLRYYAGLPIGMRGIGYAEEVAIAIEDGSLTAHDVLVLHGGREGVEHERYLVDELGYRPVQEFRHARKGNIVVFARGVVTAP